MRSGGDCGRTSGVPSWPPSRKGQLDPRLPVHRVQARQGTWELSWAADGRATFEYGAEYTRGDPHVIWRRIGDHRILDEP